MESRDGKTDNSEVGNQSDVGSDLQDRESSADIFGATGQGSADKV